ncbi:MAG: hypothetical protein K2N16_09730, partial [Muribaculaceae bacterium]|nr:hypothetical protein [Muribaculaceae bacterium]
EEPEMQGEEDVEWSHDEPFEVAYTVHHEQEVEVVDPIVSADDVNDIALEVEPEDAFIGSIDPATEEAIEIAEVAEEDFNVDDVVDDILSTDTSEFSYNENADHEFGADFDYQSGDLG